MNAVDIEGVTKTYRAAGHPPLLAVDNVTWQVATGSITGLVGESGSGKTTLMRCIMGLEKIDAGRVLSNGTILQPSGRSPRSRMRRQMQLVFQDPTASLNPRMTVGQLVSEGIQVHHLRPKGSSVSTPGTSGVTRGRSPAANASASPSPGPWPSNRRS
jgi:oligopeptide transport system ATP-binding protein